MSAARLGLVAEGRYRIFHAGVECGEERWRLERTADGLLAVGEQVHLAPHPLPNRHEYRIALTPEWRVIAVDIRWSVAARRVVASHRASAERWHARIEVDGHGREQQGDYPAYCEIETPTLLSNAFVLAKRDFALEGEHEFPVLRIGPPIMAVEPARMCYRCVEAGTYDTPLGPLPAKRYVLSLPPEPERAGYGFWADAHDVVLESFEGAEPGRVWMRLVEYRRTPD